jgi:mono/diheme cytochrome c family protein
MLSPGHLAAIALAAILFGTASLAAQAAEDDEYERPYTVIDGKVDIGTYNGYRRYGNSCHRCHGDSGVGSSYAPSLVDSLKTLSRDQFNEVVINGRQNLGAGQERVMPAFGEVADVAMYLDDIYSYLKARSDGVLRPGRPERLPPEQDPTVEK